MTERCVFMALSEELFQEATNIAHLQGITLSDLLVEALSESVEGYQRSGWVAERAVPQAERKSQVRSTRLDC